MSKKEQSFSTQLTGGDCFPIEKFGHYFPIEKFKNARFPFFQDNLQAFIDHKVPCELFSYRSQEDPEFDRWLKDTVSKVRGSLEELYSDYGILPAPVLLILAETKHLLMTQEPPLGRNTRQRRGDMKALDAALRVIEIYDAPTPCWSSSKVSLYVFPQNRPLLSREDAALGTRAQNYLNSLKREIGKIRLRKQSNVEMRFCSQTLEDFFRHVTPKQQPLHEIIGSLLVCAFAWPRDKGDLRLAALQRAKGRSIKAREITLWWALHLQNPPRIKTAHKNGGVKRITRRGATGRHGHTRSNA